MAQPGVYEITATLANFLSAGVPPFVVGRTDDKEKLDILLTINLESYPNVVSVNEAIPPQTLSPYVLSEGELAYIRELVIRKALQTHRNFPPQLDDPIGREYCLALDSVAGSRPIPAPASLVERFSDDRDVHDLSWCAAHAGRIISVGPLMLATENLVLIWVLVPSDHSRGRGRLPATPDPPGRAVGLWRCLCCRRHLPLGSKG